MYCSDALSTPMPCDELVDSARAVPAALGETRGEAVIFVGPKLSLANFYNMKRTYPRTFRSIRTPSVR
jgi:hypothetical protein